MQTVALIDYGSGNLHSAQKSLERAAREADVSSRVLVTSDCDTVRAADRIILPGVGAFADCKRGIQAVSGLWEAVTEAVHQKARPFLGICVGMQLMADRGLEFGVTDGFGWITGEVRAIAPENPELKIPHMGWNTLSLLQSHPLFEGIATGPDGLHAYFVHSYHLSASDPANVVATTEYGGAVTAAVGRDTMFGTQFHPEKSQGLGLALLANFLRWAP
ncbi:MAG: imidazole glycerol phosphate synthase subunit HisH [Pseudomonadota bacterium]